MSKRIRYLYALVATNLGLGLVGMAACSSSESAHSGQGTKFGYWPVPDGRYKKGDMDAGVIVWPSLPDAAMYPSLPEVVEPPSGLELSPEEKNIANACPRSLWSKNVPDRDCTKDDECGDGFCDRGYCSAVYTCGQNLGFRCDAPSQCGSYMCIDGRCRSCTSHEECADRSRNPYAWCHLAGAFPPGRACIATYPAPPTHELKTICDRLRGAKKPAYCD